MKRVISLILVIVFALSLGGCKKKEEGKPIEIKDLPKPTFSSTFVFALDESDWYTSLTVKDDATFEGKYYTEKSDNTGSSFPNGTIYYCNFSGNFTNIRKINDYTYSLALENINIDEQIGKEIIKQGKRHKVTYPFGIQNGKRFLLYTPNTPVSKVPTAVLSWWPLLSEHKAKPFETLSCYALVNEETSEAFFVRQ